MSFAVVLRLVISLAAIVGVLIAIRWWTRRGGRPMSSPIKIVGRTPLGRHTAVQLVEVDGVRLVLGTGEREVRLLARLDERAPVPDSEEATTIDLRDGDPGSGPPALEEDLIHAVRQGQREPVHHDATRPRIGLLRRAQRLTTVTPTQVRIRGPEN